MRESTSQPYIDAFDAARDRYMRQPYHSGFEAFAAGFASGVAYGRSTPDGPPADFAKDLDA